MKLTMDSFKFDFVRFKEELTKQGYETLEAFAEELRKHRTSANRMVVHQWLNGQQPGFKYLTLICRILKKDLNYFMME